VAARNVRRVGERIGFRAAICHGRVRRASDEADRHAKPEG
jgi:hypothetical protein